MNDLIIRSVPYVQNLVDTDVDARRALYLYEEKEVELEICKSYDEYVQWQVEQALGPNAPKKSTKLADVCKRKR
jgi:hypothetical protein